MTQIDSPSVPFFFFNDTATTEIYTLSLHDALPIWLRPRHVATGDHRIEVRQQSGRRQLAVGPWLPRSGRHRARNRMRSEEHTSELQSQSNLVCRLLLEKKKNRSAKRRIVTANPRST